MEGGKSTVGPRVAKQLGAAFYDIDDTIPQHFKEQNSKGYLVPDSEIDDYIYNTMMPAIQKLHEAGDVVVSAAFSREVYVDDLKKNFPDSVIIYLEAPIEVLIDRVKKRDAHFIDEKLMMMAHNSGLDVRKSDYTIDATKPLQQVEKSIMEILQLNK